MHMIVSLQPKVALFCVCVFVFAFFVVVFFVFWGGVVGVSSGGRIGSDWWGGV
jgi:hypothetical protein